MKFLMTSNIIAALLFGVVYILNVLKITELPMDFVPAFLCFNAAANTTMLYGLMKGKTK